MQVFSILQILQHILELLSWSWNYNLLIISRLLLYMYSNARCSLVNIFVVQYCYRRINFSQPVFYVMNDNVTEFWCIIQKSAKLLEKKKPVLEFFFYPISNQDKSVYLHKMFRVHRKHKITPKKAINNALKQNCTWTSFLCMRII